VRARQQRRRQGRRQLQRSVVHDNVFIGPQVSLRGAVVGKNTDIMRAARIGEGAVVGDECVVEEEAYVADGVKVYPFKTIEAGAVLHTSVIWESRGSASLFGPRGVSGLVNVEITPEYVVRLASAYATTLPKGSVVVTARDASRAPGRSSGAVISALNSSAIDVRDLEVAPLPVTRFMTSRSDAAGRDRPAHDARTTRSRSTSSSSTPAAATSRRPGSGRWSGSSAGRSSAGPSPGEIAELSFPQRTVETYVQELLRTVDVTGVEEARLKVVLDTAGGSVSLVLPSLLGRLGVEVLTVNNRLDERATSETVADHMRDLERLGGLVSSSRAAFGVRFDHVGERISVVDERGRLIQDDRALLVVLDLVAAERRGGRVALP
jgi:mannose-1-phosphate guanylyltransferase/phosphomannomutase